MTTTDTGPQTARKCVEPDCDEPAGGRWSPHWCPKHDRERVERISANLDAIAASFAQEETRA